MNTHKLVTGRGGRGALLAAKRRVPAARAGLVDVGLEPHGLRPDWGSAFRDNRGIALITSLIALMLLTSLLIAFAVLSTSEPTIASNQIRGAQARAMAESGMEMAIWALASTIPNPMASSVAPAPYDGSTFMTVGNLGGFYVTVRNGTATNERVVDAVGWYPTYSTTSLQKAERHVHVTLTTVKWLNPPAALSVEGDVQTKGSAVSISAASDTSCGNKNGAMASGTIASTAHPTIQGGGGAPAELTGVPTSTMDQYMFTSSDLDMLKSIAKANGTYFQGNQSFNSGNPWPTSGIVFVDSADGQDLTCTAPGPSQTCTPATSDMAAISISGAGGMPALNGWLIVNGSINWSGNATVNGLVYAVNDITMSGTPNVNGAVISKNLIDTSTTSVDSTFSGNITINYNCANAKTGGGSIPTGWFLKQGSYRELSN
jgi:type IV pilus assembly PilX-like protein